MIKINLKLVIITILCFNNYLFSANYYWDGGGADNLWTNRLNWAISDGLGGYIDPTSYPISSGNAVIFDGGIVTGALTANKNCTLSVTLTIGNVVINGYTGTLSINSSRVLTLSTGNWVSGSINNSSTNGGIVAGSITTNGTFSLIHGSGSFTVNSGITISNGTVTFANGPVSIRGNFLLQNGSFTSTSNTLTLNGSISATGGTFSHNSGTFTFGTNNGSNTVRTITNSANILNFFNLTFDNNTTTGAQHIYNTGNINVMNNLSIIAGGANSLNFVNLNTGLIRIYGNLNLLGASSYTGSAGTAVFEMLGSTAKVINSNATSSKVRKISNLTISNTAGITQIGNVGITGNFTLNALGIYNANSDTIALTGNFTNNGTFNANSGKVFFNGTNSTFQYISGTSSTLFNDIIISRSNIYPVALNSSHRMKGILKLLRSPSEFRTNGFSFTLISNAAGTASIAPIPTGASVTGNITIQRYIPGKFGRHWYQLGSPVFGATFAQIKTSATGLPPNPDNGIFITGTSIVGSNPDIPSIGLANTSSASIIALNANTGQTISPTNITNTIARGRGYQIFIRDGNASLVPHTGAKLLSFTGTITQGTFNFGLGYSPTGGNPSSGPIDGWNFISNPYPSDITANLNANGWNTSSANLVNNAVYQYDSDAKAYVTCLNGTGSVGLTGNSEIRACIISSSQGFQVRTTTGGGTLTATENVKITTGYGTGQVLLRSAKAPNTLNITLQNKETLISHSTLLRFMTDATASNDNDYDALHLQSELPYISIASKINSDVFSINSLNESYSDTVGLSVNYPAGTNTLNFVDHTFDGSYNVVLIDKILGIEQDIVKNPIYQFTSNSKSPFNSNRFHLNFKPMISLSKQMDSELTNKISIYPNPTLDGNFTISILDESMKEVTVKISNLNGQILYMKTISQNTDIQLGKNLTSGIYFVKLESENKSSTEKLIVR